MAYTIWNTFLYALLFLYAIPCLLEKKFGIDLLEEVKRFLPYIWFFIFLRAFADLGLLPITFWTVTPGIWIIAIAIYIIFKLTKKDYLLERVQYFLLAVAIAIYFIKFPINWFLLMLIAASYIISFSILYPLTFIDNRLLWVAIAQALDGATTIIGVDYLGLPEKHVISSLLHSGLLILLAKATSLYLLFLLTRENCIIAAVTVLGLLTGGRNLLLLLTHP